MYGCPKRGVVSLARSYPDLGGDVWKSKFEQLLKRVQSDLGEQAVGLAATRKS